MCVLLLDRQPHWEMEMQCWGTDLNGRSSAGCAGWAQDLGRAFLEVPGRAQRDVQDKWQAHSPCQAGGPRCPEAAGCAPCASLSLQPPAAADGGRQLRSVTSLADPVISISRQVLKSPWKPAWQQPRQRPRSQCPAGAQPVAGDR